MCLIVPTGVGPVDLGVRRRGREIWGSPGDRIGAGLGEEHSRGRRDGLGEDQLGLGEAGAAEQPAGSGGAERGRGCAGTKSGSLAASGSCAVWSPEAERKRE